MPTERTTMSQRHRSILVVNSSNLNYLILHFKKLLERGKIQHLMNYFLPIIMWKGCALVSVTLKSKKCYIWQNLDKNSGPALSFIKDWNILCVVHNCTFGNFYHNPNKEFWRSFYYFFDLKSCFYAFILKVIQDSLLTSKECWMTKHFFRHYLNCLKCKNAFGNNEYDQKNVDKTMQKIFSTDCDIFMAVLG